MLNFSIDFDAPRWPRARDFSKEVSEYLKIFRENSETQINLNADLTEKESPLKTNLLFFGKEKGRKRKRI